MLRALHELVHPLRVGGREGVGGVLQAGHGQGDLQQLGLARHGLGDAGGVQHGHEQLELNGGTVLERGFFFSQ